MPPNDKIPTPLEVVDTGADIVNRIFGAGAKIAGNALTAAGQAFKDVERDISAPREAAEIPPSPDQLISPIFKGVGHIIGGVINTGKGVVDGVIETAEGVRHEIESLGR